MTTPKQVRAALQIVTSAAIADTRTVAGAADSPAQIRAVLFEAAPLIVGDYSDGSSALALDWYEELREDATPRRRFSPSPVSLVPSEELAGSVAWATEPLYDLERGRSTAPLETARAESLRRLEPVIQKDVAAGFWDTITTNSTRDPDAAGWQRFAQSNACKFCRMCADRGAVYTRATANFSGHTTCHCVAGPAFGDVRTLTLASPMQYVAAKRVRTEKERADLRAYLHQNYPDAPG